MYEEGLSGIGRLIPIPVDLDAGEVPIYNEVLCADRDSLVKFLAAKGIETRAFYPDLDYAPYLDQGNSDFPNSRLFGTQGLYLPSGPNQKIEDIKSLRKRSEDGLWLLILETPIEIELPWQLLQEVKPIEVVRLRDL